MKNLLHSLKTFSVFRRDRNGNYEFQIRPDKLPFGVNMVTAVIGRGESETEAIIDAIAHIRVLQGRLSDINDELIEFAFREYVHKGPEDDLIDDALNGRR